MDHGLTINKLWGEKKIAAFASRTRTLCVSPFILLSVGHAVLMRHMLHVHDAKGMYRQFEFPLLQTITGV